MIKNLYDYVLLKNITFSKHLIIDGPLIQISEPESIEIIDEIIYSDDFHYEDFLNDFASPTDIFLEEINLSKNFLY